MVKYATIRKRSYKKRRTIRKLKTTLRRKIQRGGNPAISTLIFILLAVFSQSPVVEPFIKILQIYTGEKIVGTGGGSSKNFKQSGGGGEEALNKALDTFNQAIQTKTTIPPDKKQEIADCVVTLKTGNIEVPTGAAQGAPLVDVDSSKLQSLDINFLKTYFNGKIDALKSFILSKAEIMKDPYKKECMKKIFNVGFELMKTKLMSLGIDDLMKAKAAQVKAKLAASGSEMFQNFSSVLQQTPQAAAAKETGAAAISASTNFLKGKFGWGSRTNS